MKLLLTNPQIQGSLIIEDLIYTRADENHKFERFIIGVSQKYLANK